MKKIEIRMLLMAGMILVLAACSPAPKDLVEEEAAPMNTVTAIEQMPTQASEISTPAGGNEAGSTQMEDPSPATPAWFDYPLTEVTSAEVFKITDFRGKVVLVETMAIWCSNCKRQQQEVLKLHEGLGDRDDFISLGLDIDINENADDLKRYVESNNFYWKYAVATPELIREISSLYGDQFLNPPSTPMLIIDREGEVHTLPFGIKTAGDLEEWLIPYLDAPV